MQTKELIAKLQKAIERYGDMRVTIDGENIEDSAVFDGKDGEKWQFLVSTSPAE